MSAWLRPFEEERRSWALDAFPSIRTVISSSFFVVVATTSRSGSIASGSEKSSRQRERSKLDPRT